MSVEPYNYDTFRRHMIREDMHLTGGPKPGEMAPDFDLPTIEGRRFRLSDYRGVRPVFIEFASITCPMTAGARPAIHHLHNDFANRVQFVAVYVREAHPGENYSHHTSELQKFQYARDWAEQDKVPITVAVDTLDGRTHQAYGALPNPAYLIDSTGRVAFRALWAGQENFLRDKIEELLLDESAGVDPVNLGQQEHLVIPLIHGSAEFDHALARAGEKAKQDFRREMGGLTYGFEKLMSKFQPVINPDNREIE